MNKPLKNLLTDWSATDVFGSGIRIRGIATYAQEGIVDAGEVLVTSVVVSMTTRHQWIEAETRNSIYLLAVEKAND